MLKLTARKRTINVNPDINDDTDMDELHVNIDSIQIDDKMRENNFYHTGNNVTSAVHNSNQRPRHNGDCPDTTFP